ncbi:MAG: hypothetical protein M3Y56_11590 [Armatimonadota bacterium]|nr:hypothetical protein [Armatimonadota bacterium]
MSSQQAVISVLDKDAVDDAAAVKEAVEAITESLRKSKIGPPVDRILWELITDSNGIGAARITVVLEDNPSGEYYTYGEVQPIHDLFWNEFYQRGLERLPYVRFELKSELESEAKDDEYWDSPEQPV